MRDTVFWALKERSKNILLRLASELRESELLFTDPNASPRVWARKRFDERYALFLRWSMIEDTGYGPYFPQTPPKK